MNRCTEASRLGPGAGHGADRIAGHVVVRATGRRAVYSGLLTLSLACGLCLGQDRTLINSGNFASPDQTKGLRPVVELASEPVRLESVALTLYPPANSRVQKTTIQSQSAIEITPDDGKWLITVQAPRSSNLKLTAADVANAALMDLLGASGLVFDAQTGISKEEIKNIWQSNKLSGLKDVTGFKGFNGLVQDRLKDVKVEGFPSPAEQFFLSIPNKKNEPLVRGLSVVKAGPDQFVVFELFTEQRHFEQARDIFNVILHGAKLGDPTQITRERSAAVTSGIAVFEKLTTADLDAIVAASGERWERRFRPGPSGSPTDAEELGYRRIKVWKGRRGEVNSKNTPGKFSTADAQEGYLIRIDARLLEGTDMIDSQSTFFVTPDRAEEQWYVTLGVQSKDRTNKRAYSEIGVRNGDQMSVTVAGTGNSGTTSKPKIEGAGYISRVESYLLPQILIKTGLPGDFGTYVFQSDAGFIKLRRDLLRQPTEAPDSWIIETRLSDDGPPQLSTYTNEGKLIASKLPDGSVWEPTDIERLSRLWRSKGLPMN
ncbi:MAG TPA: hypothetical protein VK176_13385 [Phycisphaerales bacterium]|nr:hypothetical protein [Phycisphaerales bacterium]